MWALIKGSVDVCKEMLRKGRGEKVEGGVELGRFNIGFHYFLLIHWKQYFKEGGKFLKKLRCCVSVEYYKIIWFYQLS